MIFFNGLCDIIIVPRWKGNYDSAMKQRLFLIEETICSFSFYFYLMYFLALCST